MNPTVKVTIIRPTVLSFSRDTISSILYLRIKYGRIKVRSTVKFYLV